MSRTNKFVAHSCPVLRTAGDVVCRTVSSSAMKYSKALTWLKQNKPGWPLSLLEKNKTCKNGEYVSIYRSCQIRGCNSCLLDCSPQNPPLTMLTRKVLGVVGQKITCWTIFVRRKCLRSVAGKLGVLMIFICWTLLLLCFRAMAGLCFSKCARYPKGGLPLVVYQWVFTMMWQLGLRPLES